MSASRISPQVRKSAWPGSHEMRFVFKGRQRREEQPVFAILKTVHLNILLLDPGIERLLTALWPFSSVLDGGDRIWWYSDHYAPAFPFRFMVSRWILAGPGPNSAV